MSIVEKAVEKLKNLPTELPVSPALETAPLHTASTVERFHERTRVVDQPVESAAPLWHVEPAALKRMGILPADDAAAARLADELRLIKRPFLDNAIGKAA